MDSPLTPRQRQILDLLRAGKVNKEIASELGIGLGTVKQHVVALFKKLKVRNRAMAISRAPGSGGNGASVPRLTGDGLIERRPCVVLSIVLPEAAPAETGRLFHQTLATYAFDRDALFLARKGNAGDLIFGIQQPSEHDLLWVLRAAHTVYEALAAQDAAQAAAMRGGLAAGLAIASMNRHGGWSGEAIATPAVAQARELANEAAAGYLVLSPSALDLLQTLGPCAAAPTTAAFEFDTLDRVPWSAGVNQRAPVGRSAETGRLDALLASAADGVHHLAYLEGETGMGKSCLCRYLVAACAARGGYARHFACQPDGGAPLLFDLSAGTPANLDTVLTLLASAARARPETVIVDDCHLLSGEALLQLTRQGALPTGRFVLLAARRFPDAAAKADETLRLGRLSQIATERLVVHTLGAGGSATRATATAIARAAAGVPLFAIQLAQQQGGESLPLALRFVIGARMDSLGLDRMLLRQVARASAPLTIEELAAKMGVSAESLTSATAQAVASGVLKRDDKDRFSFNHPLLRRAVAEALVD